MAYQWVSPTAAFATALLVSLYLGCGSYWMNSYWGGAAAASGGALALGALRLLWRTHAAKYAAILAAGWSLLWFTRPFESLMFGAILAIAAAGALRRNRRAIIGVALVGAASLALFLRLNFRITGDPLKQSYVYSRTQLGVPVPFVWQKLAEEPAGLTPRQHRGFLWNVNLYREWNQSWPVELRRVKDFFLGTALLVPFLAGVWRLRSRKVRFLVLTILLGAAWSVSYVAIFPHYVAALTAPVLALAGRGLLQLSLWRIRGSPVGACLAFGLWSAAAVAALHPAHPWLAFGHPEPIGARNEALRFLDTRPGPHLVFVRYTPDYNIHDEWVFNRADLGDAKVVWVNDLGAERNAEVRRYFADRTAWIVEPAGDKQLKPYN
jgi:hypothetical protein